MLELALAATIDYTPISTAACSRRMAQLASRYGIVDLASRVVREAEAVPGGNEVLLDVTIRYRRQSGRETRRATVACVVSPTGKVLSLVGLVPE